jgi:hypothetical protein
MGEFDTQDDDSAGKLSTRTQAFIQRLYRDPRYLLLGRMERFEQDLISFVEGCTMISATGEVRGQALINSEYRLRGRPDGQRPYDRPTLVDYYLSQQAEGGTALQEEDLAALREESWQFYVRRNFAFLLEQFGQARDDAEHNLTIWNLVDQSAVSAEAKWSYLRWWPWIERDRAIAQALSHIKESQTEAASTELYRAQRSIEQYGERHAAEYEGEGEEGKALCSQMAQHISGLVEILREDEELPVSTEEQLDQARGRGDEEEVERLRKEMIRRAVADEGA